MVFSVVARGANWLKMAWVTQPIIFLSCVLGFAGMLLFFSAILYATVSQLHFVAQILKVEYFVSGPAFVYLSPLTKDTAESMKLIPEHYPCKYTTWHFDMIIYFVYYDQHPTIIMQYC